MPPVRFAGVMLFCFPGASGAGKTTISRLAPPDVTLLTDEISYVRREGNRYLACGTPFAGELARVGENQSRCPPVHSFYSRRACTTGSNQWALRKLFSELLRNILFFADDRELVKLVFSRRASLLVWFPCTA